MYLLDTDILSNLLKRAPSTTLIAKLASMPAERQFTSSITLGELVYGAYRLQARAGFLLEQLDKTLLPNLPVLPFDVAAAHRYGEVRAEMERRGIPLGDADLRIAAIDRLRRRYGFTCLQTGHTFSLKGIFETERGNYILATPSLSR